MSVPNQKIITINKPDISPPFTQVADSDWMEASKILSPKCFVIYLYLAKNANNYSFEYSPQAISNLGLMAKSTASAARRELEEKGYIVDNIFYTESPAKRAARECVQLDCQNLKQC